MDMDMLIGIGIFGLVAGIWCCVVIAVGRAAAAKGRSRTTWGFLTFMPLGPIMAPLYLASLPAVGEKATKGQLLGRTVLIVWLVVGFGARLVIDTANQQIEAEAMSKAETDYGFETEYVTTHYKKMSVEEIVECVTISQTTEAMQYEADYDADNETYYFETQGQADTYNDLNAKYNEMECQERTYDVADLGRAMKIIEGGS